MALRQVPLILLGENNFTKGGEVETAAQTTTDAYVVLATAELDTRPFHDVVFSIYNTHAANAAKAQVYGSDNADFSGEVAVGSELTITALSVGHTIISRVHLTSTLTLFRYHRIKIKASVGGAQATVKAIVKAAIL